MSNCEQMEICKIFHWAADGWTQNQKLKKAEFEKRKKAKKKKKSKKKGKNFTVHVIVL